MYRVQLEKEKLKKNNCCEENYEIKLINSFIHHLAKI